MLCKELGNSPFDEKRWTTYSVLTLSLPKGHRSAQNRAINLQQMEQKRNSCWRGWRKDPRGVWFWVKP